MRIVAQRFVGNRRKNAPQGRTGHQPWLQAMNMPNGRVMTKYWPVLAQLDQLDPARIQRFRDSVKQGDKSTIVSSWRHIAYSKYTRPTIEPQWRALAARHGAYGPPILGSAIRDFGKIKFGLLKQCWDPQRAGSSPVSAFTLPRLVHFLGTQGRWYDGLQVLRGWQENAKTPIQRQGVQMAANALLLTPEFSWTKVIKVVKAVPELKLHPRVALRLLTLPTGKQPTVLNNMIKYRTRLATRGMSSFLRTVWTSSDAGGRSVARAAQNTLLPPRFYQFLVIQLTKLGDIGTLDVIFDQFLPRLGAHNKGLVLHLLFIRLLGTEGVRATSPVLNWWGAGRLPEKTWMAMFRQFRYTGRPDKCEETLRYALQQYPKLTSPFVGEWLSFVAQFYNARVYLQAIIGVIPEIEPVLHDLEVLDTVRDWPADEGIQPRILLSPNHRRFPVDDQVGDGRRGGRGGIDESWLSITYRAVLNCVEEPYEVLNLWNAYVRYVIGHGTPKITLTVVDQFVLRLVALRTVRSVGIAEHIFNEALDKLPLVAAANGRHNCRSLEALCEALSHPVHGDISRAAVLVSKAFESGTVAKRGRALEPLVSRLDPQRQKLLTKWALKHGAVVSLP